MSVDPRRPIAPEDRIADELRQIRQRLDELSAPSGSQINRNVDLLNEFRTYVASSGTAAVPAGFPEAVITPAPSVAFTITRPLSVLLSFSIPYSFIIAGPVRTSAEIVVRYSVNGAPLIVMLSEYARSENFLEQQRVATATAFLQLPAGDHVITTAGFIALSPDTRAATDNLIAGPLTISAAVAGIQ